jgi:hypothetical protein
LYWYMKMKPKEKTVQEKLIFSSTARLPYNVSFTTCYPILLCAVMQGKVLKYYPESDFVLCNTKTQNRPGITIADFLR